MAVGYRAVVRLGDAQNAIAVAESQLASWLREKKQKGTLTIADWDGEGEHELGSNAQLVVIHDQDRHDGSRRRLYRFRERNDSGLWTVSMSALDTPQARAFQQTLVVDVDVDAQDTDEAIRRVDPPRLIRAILEAHQASDGGTPLTGEPQVMRGAEASIVRAAILDKTRTVSVIVAPLPWIDGEDDWRAAIRSLTVESVGVAATFVVDEAGCALLSEALPPSHAVQKGVIRTFAPQVDLTSPEDGLRHRKLYPATFMKHLSRTKVATDLAKRHAYSTRLRFIERDLPNDVRRGLDILSRAEASARRARDVERRVIDCRETLTPPGAVDLIDEAVAPAQVPLTRLKHMVARWLGPDRALTDETFDELSRLLETKAAEASQWEEEFDKTAEDNSRLESQLRELKSKVDDLSIDIADAEDRLRSRDHELSILRQRLVEHGQPQLTHVEADSEEDWTEPDDIMSLLDRITPGDETHRAFCRVEFTGDARVAQEVDVREPGPRYAHAFWDYIHVLYDYAEGRAEGRVPGGVHLYLTSDEISGHKCAPQRHASSESETTLNRWGNERIFPVPREVDPSEEILMAAHFKPTWRDTFAPRMHYYDDTSNTGKIYIGYIGRHLTTKDS